MPSERSVSPGKRIAESDSDREKPDPVRSKQTKKAKVAAPDTVTAEQNKPAPNGERMNKDLPVRVSFPPRAENATRIASWDIWGLAASHKKVK